MAGSGGEVVGRPLRIEEQDPHGRDWLGAGVAPGQARSFLAGTDQGLASTFDDAGADVPAGGTIPVVGHAAGLVGEVGHPRIPHRPALPPTRDRPPPPAPAPPRPGAPCHSRAKVAACPCARRVNWCSTQAVVSTVASAKSVRPNSHTRALAWNQSTIWVACGKCSAARCQIHSAPSPGTAP